MKIPTLFIRKKKLRVSAARRSMAADDMDYEEMLEPNMKLSRALLIVLILHVVAVAGIIAFNTIKSRQGAFSPRVPSVSSEAPAAAAPKNAPAAVANQTVASPAKPAPAASKPPGNIEQIKPALPITGAAEAGKVYVVVKGDNPVSIAKKLKVSESDLLTVNHIDDPRKLQIGQKLIVPSAKKTKTKSDGN